MMDGADKARILSRTPLWYVLAVEEEGEGGRRGRKRGQGRGVEEISCVSVRPTAMIGTGDIVGWRGNPGGVGVH